MKVKKPSRQDNMADGSDEPIDEFKHGKMLEAIRSADGKKRVMASQRTEYAPVSEFSVGSKVTVELDSLLSSLNKTDKLTKVRDKTKIATAKGIETLPPPLSDVESSKISRSLIYENACCEMSKWDQVVFQNRAAEQIVYPLHQPSLRLQTASQVVQRFKPATPLEQEMAALLASRHPAVPDPSPDEKRKLATLQHLEEANEMRREMQMLRARESYKSAKAKYLKKIKSKRYHRILKKEREKKEVKEFQLLQKTNPELAQEKVDRIERRRIEERMTQRHRNTGKWARTQIMKFKNDKQAVRAVQDQIELGRHLKAKQHLPSDSDDEADAEHVDGADNQEYQLTRSDSSNPWMNPAAKTGLQKIPLNEEEARKELLSGYRKIWEEDNRRRLSEAGCGVTEDAKVEMKESEISTERPGVLDKLHKRVSFKFSDESEANDSDRVEVSRENTVNNFKKSKDKTKKRKKVNSDVQTANKSTKKDENIINKSENYLKEAKEKPKKPLAKNKKSRNSRKNYKNSEKDESVDAEASIDNESDDVDLIFKEAINKKNANLSGNQNRKRKFLSNFDIAETQKQGANILKDKSGKITEGETLGRRDAKSKSCPIIDETIVRKRNWEDFDRECMDKTTPEPKEKTRLKNSKRISKKLQTATANVANGNDVGAIGTEIDPNNFIEVKELNTKLHLPDELDCYDDEAMDDRTNEDRIKENRMIIAEAFADDDVVSGFIAEKREAIEGDKVKDIDLTLPGWGTWGGKDIAVSQEIRKRFTIKAPKGPPRKDQQLGHVIINEKANNAVKPFQVDAVPFPYLNADEFEASLAAPIGKQWNPETAYRRLIAPKIITKMGSIIEPIDVDFINKSDPKKRSNLKI